MDYAESIMTLPYRDDFADPRAQSIFASIQDTPITLIWDHLLASFSVQPGDKGITIVIPATEEQPQQQIRILNVEGHRWLDEYTDNDGALYYEEDRVPTRIVADFWSDESKILGLDREASYDEDYNILEGTIAVFLDPYIYTNHFTSTRTQDDDGDRKVMDFDIRIFGPAGCDIQIQWLEDDYYNYSDGQQSTTHSIDLHFNNTHIELVVTDLEAMLDEIQEHRVLFPTATSAPMTANHVLTAKIYSKGIHAANIIPVNNDRWIVFMDGGPGTYITTAINQALTDTINNPLLVAIRDLLSMLSDDEKQDAYIDDIKSPELTNLVQCTDSDGYVSGYYYYPTQDIMLSSYCLEMYDTCGVYSHTIDGLDLYFRDSGPDTASCNNLDIYITEPGNNDPEPSNNNPPKSDNNDPEPDGDDQGGSGYEEIF